MDINALVNDEEFTAKLQGAKNLEEVTEILKSCGINVTADDLKTAYTQTQEKELDEDALDTVAGGRLTIIWPIIPWIPRWLFW